MIPHGAHVFPAGTPTGDQVRGFIDRSLALEARWDRFPRWCLSEPSGEPTSTELRARRAALLLLLRMPGTLHLDLESEVGVYAADPAPPFGLETLLQRVADAMPHFNRTVSDAQPSEVYIDWNYEYYGHRGQHDVVVAEPKVRGQASSGAFTIANFSDESVGVTEDYITIATDSSPNMDSLPPLATFWLSAK